MSVALEAASGGPRVYSLNHTAEYTVGKRSAEERWQRGRQVERWGAGRRLEPPAPGDAAPAERVPDVHLVVPLPGLVERRRGGGLRPVLHGHEQSPIRTVGNHLGVDGHPRSGICLDELERAVQVRAPA